MYCMNCGHLVSDDDDFCTECGARIVLKTPKAEPTIPREFICPNCKKPVKNGNAFCTNCGTRIQSSQNVANAPLTANPIKGATKPISQTTPIPTQDIRQIEQPLSNPTHNRASKAPAVATGIVIVFMVLTSSIAIMAAQGILPTEGLSPSTLFQPANNSSTSTNSTSTSTDPVEAEEKDTPQDAATQKEEISGEAPVTRSDSHAATNETTPVGNLINGGYAASGDDWIFYAVPTTQDGWYTSSIGRMRNDGSDSSIIYRASGSDALIWHLNYCNGRLYFNEDIGNAASVVSIAADGSDRQRIASCRPGTLCQVFQGTVYYMSLDGLTGYDPTTAKKWLYKGGTRNDELWRVWSLKDSGDPKAADGAFFFEQGRANLTVNRWSNDSVDEQTITKLSGNKTIVNVVPSAKGLWILVDNDGDEKGDEILLSSFDGSSVKQFVTCSGPVIRMNASDERIVLVVKTESETRIEMLTEESKKPVVYYQGASNETVLYPSIQGETLLFGLPDSHQLVKIPLDSPGAKPTAL